MGPLANLRVIEMVGLGPCPLAGQLLADMGAEVIVVDRKSGIDLSGDVNRRGKRSVALNLKELKGIQTVLKLAQKSDVLMEGFRPGVMERLGIGPDECLKANPRLVYGRMTGWGQEGPLSRSAGHDLNYLAITGALHAMGKKGEPPVPPLNLAADYGGGSMFLIFGILSALFERNTSGKGQVVDAAMVDGVPAMMGLVHTMLANGSWTKNREDNFIDGGAPYYRCYKTSDDKFISVGCIEPQFFAEFIKLSGLDAALCRDQNNKDRWPEMHALFEKTLAAKTRDQWNAVFAGTDACVAPVLDFDEAETFGHNRERRAFFRNNNVVQTSPAPRFDRSIPQVPAPASRTGAENESILSNAGFTTAEISELANSGILL